ncbi:hypothetical protein [Thauera aminoaromatica]|uniref:Succinylglutamate desuccinylase n=1 Tax=Thauera aminoaromatica TaxID=164330 RepID=A0A5C7T880_THASP|nr:hypothetical protein [Thauera aminoaromatica]TXH92203.1 MAG: hypothetical protein E6Q80_00905 [Thauera aminoaromatica]
MQRSRTLVVIGIHREELAFGREVVRGLPIGEVDVLEIPDGLSGRRPLPDQSFRYGTLHRALYLQLLPYLGPSHRLLIDLHSGFDDEGPSADLLCGDGGLRTRLHDILDEQGADAPLEQVRIVPLGEAGVVQARTVIPSEVWHSPAFAYLGLEIYLPNSAEGRARGVILARSLIRIAAVCAPEHVG